MGWEGVDDMDAALDVLFERAEDAVKAVVTKSSMILVRNAQANFEGSHRRGEPHVGGSKPNIVSGNLRRSIKADPVTKLGRGEYGTSVAPRMIYGRRVELGFKGSRAYPYFTPAVESSTEAIRQVGIDTWRQYMNR